MTGATGVTSMAGLAVVTSVTAMTLMRIPTMIAVVTAMRILTVVSVIRVIRMLRWRFWWTWLFWAIWTWFWTVRFVRLIVWVHIWKKSSQLCYASLFARKKLFNTTKTWCFCTWVLCSKVTFCKICFYLKAKVESTLENKKENVDFLTNDMTECGFLRFVVTEICGFWILLDSSILAQNILNQKLATYLHKKSCEISKISYCRRE